MKPFSWSTSKNERLKVERQISFDEIVVAIEEGGLLDVLLHTNPTRYPNQQNPGCTVRRVRLSGPVCSRKPTATS